MIIVLKYYLIREVKKLCGKEVHQLFTNNNEPEDAHDSDIIVIDEDDISNGMVDKNEYDDEVIIQEKEYINLLKKRMMILKTKMILILTKMKIMKNLK